MTWQAEVLIDGTATGDVLRLTEPISFWGGIDPETACVTLADHPQRGLDITGKVLVIPRLVGSSSSSAVLLELLHRGQAPAAIILGRRDAILPIGAIVARQMGWRTCPVLVLPDLPFATAERLAIAQGGRISRAP